MPAVAPSVASGATDTTSVAGVGAAPNDTLSAEVVPGPAALTVLGPDGSVRWEAPPTAGFVERDAGGESATASCWRPPSATVRSA